MKQEVSVDLGKEKNRSYNIDIERGSIGRVGSWLQNLVPNSTIFVIADPNVSDLYRDRFEQGLQKENCSFFWLAVELEEKSKNLKSVERIYQKLIELKIDRKSSIVAFGGGVIGDVAGFIAATLLRGVNFLQVPTTLLAQVDAAIGGKTGVNFEKYKNLVGCFYQPKGVLIDPECLNSLSEREFKNGVAEVIKYGVIDDPKLIKIIEENKGNWNAREQAFCDEILYRSVLCKSKIVGEDEKEEGKRAYLNFGHTLGHAVELQSREDQPGRIKHGEAVALGMAFAARLSVQKGMGREKDLNRLLDILSEFYYPLTEKLCDFESIWQAIFHDKKRIGDEVHMVLMEEFGRVRLCAVNKLEVKELFCKPNLWWRKKP